METKSSVMSYAVCPICLQNAGKVDWVHKWVVQCDNCGAAGWKRCPYAMYLDLHTVELDYVKLVLTKRLKTLL